MKLAIITDQHFGARKGAEYIHNYFKKFYDDIFFPYLEKNKIDTVIDMGDTFDNRRNIDLASLEWSKKVYYDRLQAMGITVHTIVGIHTAYYKDTTEINTVDLLLKEYDNVVVYSEPTEINIDGLDILLLPWINEENRTQTMGMIDKSVSKVAMGHLEINGFKATRGHMMEDGMDTDVFSKFNAVYSGHFHTRSTDGKINYLGNPYEMYWNDVNDTRGFHIFDTDTITHAPINNPYKLFYNVYYEDTPYQTFDSTPYENKIVKVIVRKKSSPKEFERFIAKLYSAGVEDLKIIENFDIQVGDEFDIDEDENTLSILNRYIDDSDFEYDKNIIKNIFKDLYRQACEVE